MSSNVSNHVQYHWTPDNHMSSDQMASRMIGPERFMDTDGFINSSTGNASSWSSFETPGSSEFPYAYMWQAGDAMLGNNHNDDVCEMMNILSGSSPSSSAMFGAMDESLVKKFCSWESDFRKFLYRNLHDLMLFGFVKQWYSMLSCSMHFFYITVFASC